jgi:hypothetical protein
MKRRLPLLLVSILLGCASLKEQRTSAWDPTPSEIRETFRNMQNPYQEDSFASHAFADGFITAYSLGPGSLGALIATPPSYKEAKLGEAFRAGWSQGASLAVQRSSMFVRVPR